MHRPRSPAAADNRRAVPAAPRGDLKSVEHHAFARRRPHAVRVPAGQVGAAAPEQCRSMLRARRPASVTDRTESRAFILWAERCTELRCSQTYADREPLSTVHAATSTVRRIVLATPMISALNASTSPAGIHGAPSRAVMSEGTRSFSCTRVRASTSRP
jgi:hypothetical protein